jgi:hypothetical protein
MKMKGEMNIDVTVVITLSEEEAHDIKDWAQHPKPEETKPDEIVRLALFRALYDGLEDDGS